MIFLDIEATGLDTHKNSLLSIGAVDFDNPQNQFYDECRAFDGAHIEKEALAVNGFTEKQARDITKKTDEELVRGFLRWAATCKEWTFAGQNVSLDRDFIKQTCYRYHINWPFAHRTIDLHTVAYIKTLEKGMAPILKNNHSAIDLDEILKMVGIAPREGTHNGLEDAKLEAEAFSRLVFNKKIFKEFN